MNQKRLFPICTAAIVATTFAGFISIAAADAPTANVVSGPEIGEYLGPFNVVKIAGAADDDVPEGTTLCYRCRNAQRPQVVVFTRSTGEAATKLVQKLDQAITDHSDHQLRVFVNVLGDNEDKTRETAKQFATATGAKHVPFVVPEDHLNGPRNYALSNDAEITITMANDSTVKGNIAVTKADDLDVAMVIEKIQELVN